MGRAGASRGRAFGWNKTTAYAGPMEGHLGTGNRSAETGMGGVTGTHEALGAKVRTPFS